MKVFRKVLKNKLFYLVLLLGVFVIPIFSFNLQAQEESIPSRYVQTTSADFNSSGNYTGTESYIILPADKPDGYQIVNPNVIGVATNGDYLTSCQNMFRDNPSLYLELDYLDTSNVTTTRSMFNGSQATTIDLSSFDIGGICDTYFKV